MHTTNLRKVGGLSEYAGLFLRLCWTSFGSRLGLPWDW